jgi:hypothetical protein
MREMYKQGVAMQAAAQQQQVRASPLPLSA